MEYMVMTSQDYGIREKGYADFTRTIRYKRELGSEQWEFDMIIEEIPLKNLDQHISDLELMKTKINELVDKCNDLQDQINELKSTKEVMSP